MNTVRRRVAVLLVALLGAGASLITTGPAAAAPAPGTVISSVPAALPGELSGLATAKRIQYVSTDVNGATIPATGLVLTPKKGKNNKTVAWGHGSTGLADQCAPSISQAVFWPEARAAIAGLLRRGWTVAAPDYPGLGTPQPHPYFVGKSEARGVIDSVKAARNLDSSLSTQYVVDGHSQGGQAALFVGELAPSYDGPLELRGVVGIAPVSHVDILAPAIPEFPDSIVAKMVRWENPAQSPPSAPILLVQGTADEAVPAVVTEMFLTDRNDAYPTALIQLKEYEGEDHEGAVYASVDYVADWIAARFR
jgi:pimeloyl-ACP methyl ester carboxylesterase